MRKSKLELYEEVLSILLNKDLSVDRLTCECNIDWAAAIKLLDFLEENRLVEKNCNDTKVLYSLTARGEAVYRTLTITKRLNKLKKSIKIVNKNSPPLPVLTE